jgi:Flp pilus assembly protein TadD
MGDLSGAEAVLREAVRLRPELAATHLNLGLTLAAAGKADEARVHLRKPEAK